MENKRYYWLKLKEDFFEEDTISWLEEQENGKDYCLFYLKLCLKSLKTDGMLIRRVGNILIPYDVKKLSEITNTDLDTTRVAMEVLKQIGLVDILDNGEIYLSQLQNMVGSETASTIRSRKSRGNEKVLQCNTNATLLQQDCNIEIEKEIDKDKELEIDKDKEDIYNLFSNFIPNLNPSDYERISAMSNSYSIDEIKDAISVASDNGAYSTKYVMAVLSNPKKKNKQVYKTTPSCMKPVPEDEPISKEEEEHLKEMFEGFFNE